LLENRLVIAAELLVAVILQTLQAAGFISAALIYLFVIGWLSLWLRKSGWRLLGLSRPSSWLRTIGIGAVVGLAYQAVSIWLVVPWLQRLANEPPELSQLAALQGNVWQLILWLAVSWTIGAFGEEMVYRGYLLNRAAGLFGRSRAGWAWGVIGSSVLFGFGHAYQGLTGIVDTFLFAWVMSGLYLAGRRNLWLPVIAHGVYDTAAFALIFLGLYPWRM
jgi:membrane protease YdiL (CAAX protease family)